ncbi:MAG TPA: hypothetical protein PKI12_08150, partial [Bacteroidales bacterium]|nr:hypothetical protein [Bacteroidales bacterium]
MNIVYEQGSTGEPWQVSKTGGVSNRSGHTIRYLNRFNIASDVYRWICDETNQIPKALNADKYYAASSLSVVRIYDENAPTAGTTSTDNWTEEYKDKDGRVVLRRTTSDGSAMMSTYYVYDDLGLLRYVIPPLATITTDGSNNAVLASGDLANLCYIYRYDNRQRMVVKKL